MHGHMGCHFNVGDLRVSHLKAQKRKTYVFTLILGENYGKAHEIGALRLLKLTIVDHS